ncbi:MAG TPA: cation:proton antiporter [Vicinamibacterales bacterium]|nr:cation:proton antiporter [Vicinamibacterales bacterium]
MTRSSSRLWTAALYAGMVLGTIGLFLLIRGYGEGLPAPPPAAGGTSGGSAATATPDTLFHVLLALAAVLVAGRSTGLLLGLLGQPVVIGEVVAGILLGPSLLGRVAPSVSAYILPVEVAPYLGLVAQIGVAFYMFLVGLDLNVALLRRRASAAVATSHASIVVPFLLGSTMALYLYPRLSTSDVSFTSFALFMGVALSVTAFPVLARILADRGMAQTEFGAVALACAAADDVTAWCLLAFVSGVAQARGAGALVVAVLTAGFIACMFIFIRPLAVRLVDRARDTPPTSGAIAFVLLCVLLSAVTTELIGVHAIFGAFLFGVIVPHDSALARALIQRLQDFVTILLLPAFFAITGMRTRIDLLAGYDQWLVCGMIVVVATLGKFGGTLAAARLTGLNWRQASTLGILMNTRGLMELIVLNVGLDLGVISPTLFAMLVIMALVTTLATTPVVQLVHRQKMVEARSDSWLANIG